ncbi:hypothetical protein DLM75_21485 [Leptospira stimsonii]|uniref:Uncharacterized protein n=1 Tax=Leptospira stimsonii TaxID=2202203 RepID=A0A396YQM9_9LEPT|nr:hypothetical protein DLM75_21485 [Leptospira stimsonii]
MRCKNEFAPIPRAFFLRTNTRRRSWYFATALIQIFLRTGNIFVRRILISIAGSSSANERPAMF